MIQIKDTIYLHSLSIQDVPAIYKTINKERNYLREWLPFVDAATNISVTHTYVQSVLDSGQVQYSIYEEQDFIGLIGFNNMDKINKKAEIGYWICEKQQGRGIVINAVKKLLEIAFSELGLNSVRIKAAIDNQKSRNIPKKLGFRQEGIERAGELLVDNQFTDLVVYSMIKEEYTLSI